MTRTLSLAAMLLAAATVWLMPPPSQAANWPVPVVATERGAIVTPAMGRRDRKCPKGEVYDRERRECVPRAKKETKKETKKEPKKEY
ncbi:MAG TPA: hypothetical protein VE665_00475 [Hyphomicrobiaceae bacterium]|nr:hypothetical protein [Hyphomicrobiaceae bacterium]